MITGLCFSITFTAPNNPDDDEDVYDPGAQKTRRGPKINVNKFRW